MYIAAFFFFTITKIWKTKDEMLGMASPTQKPWIWASSGSWWWAMKPGVLQSIDVGSRHTSSIVEPWKHLLSERSQTPKTIYNRIPFIWHSDKGKTIEWRGFPWWLSGREPACQCRRCRFDPCVWKIPWRKKWQPTPIFLPGEFHGQRNLVGYSLWGCKRVGPWLSN